MSGPATQLTDKIRKDVEKVSQDKVRGAIVKRLRILFAHAPEIRSKRGAQGKWLYPAVVSGAKTLRKAGSQNYRISYKAGSSKGRMKNSLKKVGRSVRKVKVLG